MYALASAGFQPGEPAWKPWRRFDSSQLPPATRHWLLDEGSLTAILQAACGNRLRVRVLRQAWQRPRASERRALGLGTHEVALVREVLLECAGEPWVFARSIMPAATLRGRLRHLRRFGERSLGALLFSSRGLRMVQPLIKSTRTVVMVGCSMATPHNSPSPCVAWQSPRNRKPPAAWTGR